MKILVAGDAVCQGPSCSYRADSGLFKQPLDAPVHVGDGIFLHLAAPGSEVGLFFDCEHEWFQRLVPPQPVRDGLRAVGPVLLSYPYGLTLAQLRSTRSRWPSGQPPARRAQPARFSRSHESHPSPAAFRRFARRVRFPRQFTSFILTHVERNRRRFTGGTGSAHGVTFFSGSIFLSCPGR